MAVRHRRTALVLDGWTGPALACVASLGSNGWRVLAERGSRAARSRHTDSAVDVPDAEGDRASFEEALSRCTASERVDVVVPCTDASLQRLWENTHALHGARILGCDRGSFDRLLDKAGCLTAAESCGFPTPRWAVPTTAEDAPGVVQTIGLPAVVKPRRSYALCDGRLTQRRHQRIRAGDDVVAAVVGATDHLGCLPLIQEYVPGRALAASAIVWDGRVVAFVARETMSFYPVQGGTSVWKRTISPHDGGVQAALELLVALGYEGLAEVEYQLDESGTPRLMEIGLRSHGWLSLAIAAGVDLPAIAAGLLVGERPPVVTAYTVGKEMRWPKGELLRVSKAVRRAPPAGVRRRDLLRTAWPPWKPGMSYDGLRRGDLAPWLPVAPRPRARAGHR